MTIYTTNNGMIPIVANSFSCWSAFAFHTQVSSNGVKKIADCFESNNFLSISSSSYADQLRSNKDQGKYHPLDTWDPQKSPTMEIWRILKAFEKKSNRVVGWTN